MPIRSSAAVLVVMTAASAGWSMPVAAQSAPDFGIDWGRASDGASMALRGAPVDLSVTSSAQTRDDLWLHPVPRGFDTTDHRVHGDLGWRAAGAVFGAHFDWRDLAPRAELGAGCQIAPVEMGAEHRAGGAPSEIAVHAMVGGVESPRHRVQPEIVARLRARGHRQIDRCAAQRHAGAVGRASPVDAEVGCGLGSDGHRPACAGRRHHHEHCGR